MGFRSNILFVIKGLLWAGANKLGRWILGHLGFFGPIISTHFGTVSPLSMFSFIQPLFLPKKLSLYLQTPNFYLGLRFEFGPQRIRNLAFECPQSFCTKLMFRSSYIFIFWFLVFWSLQLHDFLFICLAHLASLNVNKE